uniref:Uncharacterized protein n=1 Tax=Arundo donax TaxID=35708 RepID=A0A0A9C1X5_ARUDO
MGHVDGHLFSTICLVYCYYRGELHNKLKYSIQLATRFPEKHERT